MTCRLVSWRSLLPTAVLTLSFVGASSACDRFAEHFRDWSVGHPQCLWVEGYRLPYASHTTWHVFDPTGEWLGSLHPPNGLRVLQVGRDYVLGWYRDELDVQHVVVYPLDRGA